MKTKVFILLLIIIPFAYSIQSCDWLLGNLPIEPYKNEHIGRWYLENNTIVNLCISYTEEDEPFSFPSNEKYEILNLQSLEQTCFSELYTRHKDKFTIIRVYVENENIPILEWRLSNKDEPGKQFFNESSWEKEVIPFEYNEDLSTTEWTFHITDDDLRAAGWEPKQ